MERAGRYRGVYADTTRLKQKYSKQAQLRTRLTHESERQHGSPFRLVRFIVEFPLMFRWWRMLASTSSTFTRHENPPGSLILVKISLFFYAKQNE